MACLLFHNLMHGENEDQLTPGCSNVIFSHGCLLLATVVCSILGEILQVSHSCEEVLALKKEIARCQVEADKLRTAISLNKVCSSSQRCKRPSQILPCRRPSNIPPPPPPFLMLPPLFRSIRPHYALLDPWSVAQQAFAPSFAPTQSQQYVSVFQQLHPACQASTL